MSKLIYIETTIPSYLAARPSRDLLQAARQQLTHDWWNNRRHEFELCLSEIVLEEAAAGDADAVRSALVAVQSMLDVFGLRADDPAWVAGGDARLRPILDGVVSELLAQRAAARGRKDFAASDAIRDRLTSLGISVEDTPTGPRWSI